MTDPNPNDSTEAKTDPQVIELEAEDVTVKPADDASTAAPTPPPVKRRKSGVPWLASVAVLALGVAAGAWLYRGVLASYFPTDQMASLQARVDTLEAGGKTLGDQLQAVSQSAQDAAAKVAQVDGAVTAAATAAKQAQEAATAADARASTIEGRVTGLAKDIEALRQTLAALGTTSGAGTGGATVDAAVLAGIGQRLDTLEKDVASLKSSAGSGAETAAALTQSLSDIKAKIAAGLAYRAEFDRLMRMVPAAAGLDVLGGHADAGLPTAAGLAAELRAGLPTLPKPVTEDASSDGGYWGSVLDSLSGFITIRTIGDTNWPQLAESCAALAEAGDVAQAIASIDAAEGEKPSLVMQWRDRAAARLKLEAALAEAETAILRQIAVLGGGK